MMRYVKIHARTYNEAMMKLKTEHGDDAIPISHKYVKEGGILNSRLFAREVVELTAGVQDRKTTQKLKQEKRNIDFTVGDSRGLDTLLAAKSRPVMEKAAAAPRDTHMESINRTIDVLNENLNDLRTGNEQKKVAPEPVKDYTENAEQEETRGAVGESLTIKRFEKEFLDLKDTLNKLVNSKNSETGHGHTSAQEHSVINKYMEVLRKNDYDTEQCNSIIKEVKNSVSKDDLKDEYKIEKSLKDLLKSRIVTSGPIKITNKKKIIMFVGPTGVGKTTTLAKLGALHSLREGNRVVFITIDNYRIAATEQLKKYAEIMRIPIYAINDQKEFRSVIDKEKADIILVDTSGRSHRNELKISEIKSYADLVDYDFEKILCVSANTKKSDLHDVFRAFDIMNFDSVIITKVDETSTIGNVVDIADKYSKPISYFTNGQEVPNDIEVADTDKIVDMIMGGAKL